MAHSAVVIRETEGAHYWEKADNEPGFTIKAKQ